MRGVILAGGGATRFGGQPKGLERVRGGRILDRLVEEFTAAFGQPPLLVANDPAAHEWHPGLEVVADHAPGLGALGGIQTAVLAGPAPVVVVAWDMPFVTRGLLERLAQGLAGHDACLPASDSRRGVEPLCAAYGPACGPAIAAALARGDQRAIGFHQGLRVGILPVEEVAAIGDPARLFFNINTPDDLTRANELA
ncbi:MAG: molybdenum cofactor guanylyltransferase [Gemmatimonadales bacterium]